MEDTGLLDLGNYPEIFADGIGDVFTVGPMAHVILFKWHKLNGVFRRIIAGEVIRPVGAVSLDQVAKWGAIFKVEAGALRMH
jgi:hypothetical protein